MSTETETLEYQLSTARLYGCHVDACSDGVRVLNVRGIGPCRVAGDIAIRELLANAIQMARAGHLLSRCHEDEIPDGVDYDRWFARSFVDGVRVGYC